MNPWAVSREDDSFWGVPTIFSQTLSSEAMSESLDFEVTCPNNHDQTVTLTREEFEKTLKSGALVFHCNTCEINWPPSHEEIAKFRKAFSKEPA
jgi:hypothetical protein